MYVLTHVDSMLLLMVNWLERERVLLRRCHGCACGACPRVMNAVAGTGCFAPSTSPRLSHSVSVLHGHTKHSIQCRLNIPSTYLLRLDPIIFILCLIAWNLFPVWPNADSINRHSLAFYNNTVIFVCKRDVILFRLHSYSVN